MSYIKLIFVSFIASLFFTTTISGQTFISNKSPIDKNRYDGITGSPYYFDDHIEAEVYLKNDTKVYPVVMNVNLQEDEIEVFEKGQYAVLDSESIMYITFKTHGKIFLVDGKIIIQCFKSDKYQLLDNPRISIRESTHRPPGEVIIKKKFSIKNAYQLLIDDSSYNIEVKKKSIIKLLGKEAEKSAKNNRNKLKQIDDLVDLLSTLSGS